MKKCGFGLALISLLSLVSCNKNIIDYKSCLDLYIVNKEKTPIYYDGFTIVQLADIHWSTTTNVFEQRQYLTNLLNEISKEKGKIDLLELTGDQVMLFSKDVITDLINTLESIGIPYAVTWGNHDRHGEASPTWISNAFSSAPHCLYTQVDNDNVYGNSNYVINLYNDSNNCKWQIVNLDSGADYADNSVGIGMTYDYIREDQAAWWKSEHDLVGKDVPVIAYYHIAQHEMEEAWNEFKDAGDSYTGKQKFFKFESFASSSANKVPYFFNIAKDNGLKGIFVGHCHANDWTADYQGVTIGCGVKTGKELYYAKVSLEDAKKVGINRAFDLVGASVVSLHNDGTFDLDHFYFDNNGLNEWVKY